MRAWKRWCGIPAGLPLSRQKESPHLNDSEMGALSCRTEADALVGETDLSDVVGKRHIRLIFVLELVDGLDIDRYRIPVGHR